MTKRLIVSLTAVGIMLILVVLFFVFTTDWNPQTERIDLGEKPNARRNRFLALGRFLETQYGWDVSYSVGRSTNEDAYYDLTIAALEFLPSIQEFEDPFPHSDYLMTGPGLILQGVSLPAQYYNEALLDELGIRGIRESEGELSAKYVARDEPSVEPRLVHHDEATLEATYPRRFDLQFHQPFIPSVIGFSNGVLCLDSLEMLSNGAIDQADNIRIADLAFNLFELPPGSKVHIVYGVFSPSIWQWLLGQGKWLTILVVVTAGLVVWHWLPRLGPLHGAREEERRSLVEHLRASGKFLLTYRHYTAMVAAARQVILERLRKRGLDTSTRDLPKPVSALSAMPEDQIRYALTAKIDRRSVVRCGQILQELQRKI